MPTSQEVVEKYSLLTNNPIYHLEYPARKFIEILSSCNQRAFGMLPQSGGYAQKTMLVGIAQAITKTRRASFTIHNSQFIIHHYHRFHLRQHILWQMTLHTMPARNLLHGRHFPLTQPARHLILKPTTGLERATRRRV